MELYIPSLLLLLLAGLVVFGILPRLGPLILVIIVVTMLALVGWQHSNMFRDEYARSTWQTSLVNISTPFLIAIAVLFVLGFLLNFVRSGIHGSSATPSPPRSSMNYSPTEQRAAWSLIKKP